MKLEIVIFLIFGGAFISNLPLGIRLKSGFDFKNSTVTCVACHAAIDSLHILWARNFTHNAIAKLIEIVCTYGHIENKRICHAIVNEMKDEILYIINQIILDPRQICGIMLNDCGHPFDPIDGNWSIKINGNKKPVKPWPTPMKNAQTLRVLHLTDIHFDLEYDPGSEVWCNEPICCRNGTAAASLNETKSAGTWGSFGFCDIPLSTVNAILIDIAQNEDFDYVLWTGDLIPHDVWNYTKRRTEEMLAELSQLFHRHFQHKLILAAVGNHEGVPCDSFPPQYVPSRFSNDWLYSALAHQWKTWSPSIDQLSVLDKASYSVQLTPTLRVISINTQYCYATNFWVYLNSTDPDNALQWLSDQLQEAEDQNQKVHIIGHVPPGDESCLRQWSANYEKLIFRYENTVVAQFFGHIHYDSFTVFREKNQTLSRPYNLYYTAPSISTFFQVNPAYRIYSIDAGFGRTFENATWTVIDYETRALDIDETSRQNRLVWQPKKHVKAEYGMSDLSPFSWLKLVNQFNTTDKLFKQYLSNYYRVPMEQVPECDDKCRWAYICEMLTSRSHSKDQLCNNL